MSINFLILLSFSEIILLDSSMPSNMVHQQLYIPQQQQLPPQQRPSPQQPQQPPPQQQTSRLAPVSSQASQQTAFKSATPKRPRSPSPPSQVPVSLYHGYGYKTAPQAPPVATSQYQGSPQSEFNYGNARTIFLLYLHLYLVTFTDI